MCRVWREYDVAGIGGGEFTLRLIPRQKVAPLFWRSDTHTHLQAPQQPSKIIVESRDHEESVDLAKLQNGMLQLMYASSEINWNDGIAKSNCLATFSKGFLNLLARSASVQATQLTNLFVTIFSTKPKDEDNNTPLYSLNRLMSLVVFPPKFTKGHLNASFQSSDLETGTIYMSASIHLFHYTPQTNRKLVKDTAKEIEEEPIEINWCIIEKDRKQVSLMIESVGHVNTMDDIAMTCANICSVQLAIVDVSAGKPLLYQFTWKVIKFIENKKTKNWMHDSSDCILNLPMVFMAKIHQFFQHLASFLQKSINIYKIEVVDDKFDVKNVTIVVKLASKFFSKMQEHVDDNSIPKDVPAFARSFFFEATGGGIYSCTKGQRCQKTKYHPTS
jgi:hypothetical protein